MSNVIKERIRNKRKELSLTQKGLAEKINVSPQVISNWERGYTPEIGNDDLYRLATALNVSTDYLLGLTNDQKRFGFKVPQNLDGNHVVKEVSKVFTTNKDAAELLPYVMDEVENYIAKENNSGLADFVKTIPHEKLEKDLAEILPIANKIKGLSAKNKEAILTIIDSLSSN